MARQRQEGTLRGHGDILCVPRAGGHTSKFVC